MSTRAREPYDHWRDVAGVHIDDGARVQQVGLAPNRGARRSRLNTVGVVVGRGSKKLRVVFGDRECTIHPSMVRVVPLTRERIVQDLHLLLHEFAGSE